MTSDIGFFIIGISWITVFVLMLALVTRLERLLDRYRLKYGFDKEIEFKEVGGKTEEKKEDRIESRERSWRRRVFKD